MAEFEQTGTVDASADAVFAYVADVAHVAELVPEMVSAAPAGDAVRVAASVQGRHEEGNAWFRADPDRRRIEWGSTASAGYHGWLEVAPAGGGCQVTVHLTTQRDEDASEIERSLSETLERLIARAPDL